jgi:hypothetical protein
MSPAKLAPGRRGKINLNQPRENRLPEISEKDLRSQVEHKFVEMNEVHDRIRGEFLQSHNEQRSYPDHEHFKFDM